MNILQSIRDLVERPGFFTSLEFTRGRTIRFYSLLILIFTVAAVVVSLPGAVRFVSTITSQAWQEETEVVIGLYPEELEVRVENGMVSTNAEEPLAIAFPESWRAEEYSGMPENLLVIDTTKRIALEDFATQQTSFILGKNEIGAWDQQKGKFNIYALERTGEKKPLIVTKESYTRFVSDASRILQKILLVGVFLLPIFLYAVYWVSSLLYLIFGAGIVWLITKQRGYTLSYPNAYRAGIYLLPVPLAYDVVVILFSDFPQVRIPFLFTVLLVIMTLRNFPPRGSSEPSPSTTTTAEGDKTETSA